MTVFPFPAPQTLVQLLIEIYPPGTLGHRRYTVIVWQNHFRYDGMSGEVRTMKEAKRLAAKLQAIVEKGLRK